MKYIKNLLPILIIIGLQLILFEIFDNSKISLACGLFAFIGTDAKANFSWDKFNMLGWFNDSRGGDACGRVVGNLCEHGTEELKTYKEFAMKMKNPTMEITQNCILGHCRKASSGGKDSIYAQPIILRKKDVNMKAIKDTHMKNAIKTLKEDDIVFSGIHNGTIDNYKELAPEFGIPTEDHNDSKVLLSILFYGNYEILTKYEGTAALIWHNHITNKSYVFKGASKYYTASATITEERPLYYWEISPTNFYISSIDDSLLLIGATKEKITDIDCNTLYTFKAGSKVKVEIINRTNRFQTKVTKWENNNFNHKNFGSHFDYYHKVDRDYESARQVNLPGLWTPSKDKKISIKGFLTSNTDLLDKMRIFSLCENPIRIQSEINQCFVAKSVRRIIYNKSRYWMSGSLMHGVYALNSIGLIPNRTTRDASILKMYYFIEGIMMDGVTGYNKAIQLHGEMIDDIQNAILDIETIEETFVEQIVKYSRYPTATLFKTSGQQDMLSCNKTSPAQGAKFYDGDYQPLFSDRRYGFKYGDLVSIVMEKDGVKTAVHTDDDVTLSNEYMKRCQTGVALAETMTLGQRLLYTEDKLNPFSPLQNTVFSVCNTKDSNTMALFIVHYMRDFKISLKQDCMLCVNDKTNLIHTCISCKQFNRDTEDIKEEVDYEVFK